MQRVSAFHRFAKVLVSLIIEFVFLFDIWFYDGIVTPL